MQTHYCPVMAHLHQTGTIHLKDIHCGPAADCAPNNPSEVVMPPKMAGPLLAPGMEKRDPPAGQGISCPDSYSFGAIAQGAGQGQIVQFRLAPFGYGTDVIYVECCHRKILTAQAIFATVFRSFEDFLSECWGYKRRRGHRASLRI